MRKVGSLAALLTVAVLAIAGSAYAHNGAAPFVIVQADFILPGKTFQVVVTDIGKDAPVDFAIVKDQQSASLGSTRAAPDGHLMVDLRVPADFPLGYAQLSATVPQVISTSTWVLIGERTAATPAPPSTASTAAWWADPSVIVLGVLLVGVIGAIGYLLFKPKSAEPQPVVTASGPRRSSGKRSRR